MDEKTSVCFRWFNFVGVVLNAVLLMLINVHCPYRYTYEMNIITVTPTTLCLVKKSYCMRHNEDMPEGKHVLCKWPHDSSRLSDVSTCCAAWRQGRFKHPDPGYEAGLTTSDWPLTFRSGCVNQEHIHKDTLTNSVFVLCLILSKVSLPGTGTLRQVAALLFLKSLFFLEYFIFPGWQRLRLPLRPIA